MMNSKALVYFVGALVVLLMITVACSSGFLAGQVATPSPAAVLEEPEPVQPELNTQPAPEPTTPPQAANPPEPEPQTAVPTKEVQSRNPAEPVDVEELFEPFWETWEIIQNQYVDQPLNNHALVRGAIQGMQDALEPTTTEEAANPHEPEPQAAAPTEEVQSTDPAEPVDIEELFEPFWSAWENIQNEYVDQPLDNDALMRGAIRGMLDALGDPHTSYMDPDQFRQASIPLEQEYEGIGAWVDTNAEYLTIVTPMRDSPAEKAGLKPGDQVIAIEGEDMTGIDGNLVIRRVLGPAGTPVRLTIQRSGDEGAEPEIFEVEIVRARINIPSVESEMLENEIAYLKLFQFSEKTRSELRKALEVLLAQNPTGLIVDLRNNGGGYLGTSIEVASEFISEGTILIEEYGDGRRDVYEALRGGVATKIPMVVLINEGSASASEIVAGAIQDYGRAPLVGSTSFGKGSVQNWVPLSEEQGAVRVTIARWLTPTERQIHGVGLEPDVAVEMTEEDINAERDPQLDKAIEILTNP